MRLGDLWAKHGSDTLWPDSAATKDLFIFGVTDDSRDVRYGFHPSMQAYFQAKMRLFNERLKADGVAVINTRDTAGFRSYRQCDREILASSPMPLHDSRGRPMTKKIPFSDARMIREIIASM
ncbi:MAG: UDP-N-acetylmuramoyl-L-alanyl-D-glutamate--2,6-diaminopimelate ligase [Bacteroidetes bacterium]|nr:UDP-N-acetylmuramoyl-L-alanyl-D-glutamate--2,6-diaminopimelate ligase [Bacteroidota bacterium]